MNNNNRSFIPLDKLKQRAQRRRLAINRNNDNNKKPPQQQQEGPVSLLKYCTFVYDQGNLGSCTAQAFCTAFRVQALLQKKYTGFVPSRLFFYYNERVIENTVNEDAGADVIDGEAYVKSKGICSESQWPYVISRFTVKPTTLCYFTAPKQKIKSFQVLTQTGMQLVAAMQAQLQNKQPLLLAMAVYDSFLRVANTGVLPMPDLATETCQGGHELCVLGYDKQAFQAMNSWGTSWGLHGTCWIPFAYVANPELCFEVTWFSL